MKKATTERQKIKLGDSQMIRKFVCVCAWHCSSCTPHGLERTNKIKACVPTRSPAHIPASSPPVPALTANGNNNIDMLSSAIQKFHNVTAMRCSRQGEANDP